MQQRIRAQAKKLGYSIVIRYEADTASLYFKATPMTSTNTSVDASDVAGLVKNKTKNK